MTKGRVVRFVLVAIASCLLFLAMPTLPSYSNSNLAIDLRIGANSISAI